MNLFFKKDKNIEEKKDEDNKEEEKKDEEVKVDNYDHNQSHEIRMEEKIDQEDGNNLKETIIRKIEYDMSENKRQVQMKLEDKVQMELMRRWHIKIYNIYITPLREMMDPFLQFTIGGDFSVDVYSSKSGKTFKVPRGKRGYADKTEILKNIDKLNKEPFDKIIDVEMRMSYSMVNNQKMMIELWDYNTVWMNTIKGYTTIPLITIANGNVDISVDILRREKKRKNPIYIAQIDFKCLFQEIWDFKLEFLSWKTSSLLNPKRANQSKKVEDYPSASLEISLIDNGCTKAQNIISDVSKNTEVPVWASFSDVIFIRATMNQLENQSLRLKLWDNNPFIKDLMAEKVVGLKNILSSQRLKTDFLLVDKITKDKYYTVVEGSVNIDHKIKYKQSGESIVLNSKKRYLCINVMRVEGIRPAETRGIVDSFISIEWCGMTQNTRVAKENNNPVFNEILYFEIPIPQDLLKDIENPKNVQKINEEFSSKNEIRFDLMIVGDDNTYDNLGIAEFHLSDIKDGQAQGRKYFADDLKKDKNYTSRIYTGKSKLTSAFSLSNNTYVHYEAWFLEDFSSKIDFGEKKKKSEKGDKIPVELVNYLENGKDKFETEFLKNLRNHFQRYTNYAFKERMYAFLRPSDQYKNTHLLPYFLSNISLPEKIYSKDDMSKDPNFFDCNLETLDEVAHFCRCFPFNLDDKLEIWATPDFTIKIRKGGIDEHTLLMASLMLGLRKRENKKRYYEIYEEEVKTKKSNKSNDTTKTDADTTTTTGGTTKDSKEDKFMFPYENRVFICLGKLKVTRASHTWVMSFNEDYTDVTFWEPKLSYKFDLIGRVDDPNKLKNFLDGKYPNYESVKTGNIVEKKETEFEEEPIKKEKVKYDDRKPIDMCEYDQDDDLKYDEGVNENEILLNDYNVAGKNDEILKKKNAISNIVDDYMLYKTDDGVKTFDFLQEQKEQLQNEINQSPDAFFLPVEDFKDKRTKQSVITPTMPYETIDLIFNRSNIYANRQFHDPAYIKFNIYDNQSWYPYIKLENGDIFRSKFEPFYPSSNLGPVLSPGLVNKMRESLIKEMRIGITAARSGMNLQTKFKKKNEQINNILRNYCDYLEDRALNRISQKKFDSKVNEWMDMIKTKLPKFYKMEAKCVYFNFFELEIIRKEVNEDLEKFYNTKMKKLMFATSAKVYAYMNQIVSTRIILAKFYKIPEEDIPDEELKEYKLLEKQEQKLEEEQDSEEEDETTTANDGKTEQTSLKHNKEITGNIVVENTPKK